MHAVHVLDNPAWHALVGTQASLGRGDGLARRFDPEVSVFAAVPDEPRAEHWDALRALIGSLGGGAVVRSELPDLDGWSVRFRAGAVQMVHSRAGDGRSVDGDVVVERLGPNDVPEMTDLVERTRPGPFTARTIELGTYLGVRDEGRLVAMAGTRMRPAGYTEISAVCTDEGHRGRGLARLLVTRMVEEIEARDETPCLHALDSNAGAIRLYEQLGFTVRTVMTFAVVLPDQ
jgi:ribosomal protein S18 acetylase RimI-like enzyme